MNLAVEFARWRSDVPSGGNRYDEEPEFVKGFETSGSG